MPESPFNSEPLWWLTRDGDVECLELYARHYSARHYRNGRRIRQFVGPGEKVVLRTIEADALFVWRKFLDDSIDTQTRERQDGINCAVFRNESRHRSSDLIRQACAIAAVLWPDSRYYTYVDASKIRSTNAGCCFQKAGWTRAGMNKAGQLVFEKKPDPLGTPEDPPVVVARR